MRRRLALILFFFSLLVSKSSFLVAQDTSCGIVWYPPIQVSPGITGVNEHKPSLAVQGDTVHVTWGFTSQRFPYRRSPNNGFSFEAVRELAPDSTPEIVHGFLLTSGTWVYAFWIDFENIQNNAWMSRSMDFGTNWDTPRIIRDSTGFWHFGAVSGDTVVLGVLRDGENRRVFRSTNKGETWSEGPQFIGNDPRIAMTPGIIHMVRYWPYDSAGVWAEFVAQYSKSTDLGETWSDSVNLSSMNSYAFEPSIGACMVGDSAAVLTSWKDEKYGCLTLGFCSILGRHSNNGGANFEPELRFDTEPRGAFTTSNINDRFAVVAWSDEYMGVIARVSTDRGNSWCEPYVVAPTGGIQAVALSSNTIHIAWEQRTGGRWRIYYRRGVLLPSDVEDDQIPPRIARLDQNYPNPFNPQTRISFILSSQERDGVRSQVTLKIYDMLGREVGTLVNEKKDAGEHTVDWNAEGLPSGVYYYRLVAGGRIETRKAILIR